MADWKNLHFADRETVATVDLMEGKLRAPLEPLNTIEWCDGPKGSRVVP